MKYIKSIDEKLIKFDINRITEWTQENVRKFKQYIVENFTDYQVMFNFMVYDRQLQELQQNYKLIRSIRDNEQMLTSLMATLKTNFNEMHGITGDWKKHSTSPLGKARIDSILRKKKQSFVDIPQVKKHYKIMPMKQ